jgi:hypothetical protein
VSSTRGCRAASRSSSSTHDRRGLILQPPLGLKVASTWSLLSRALIDPAVAGRPVNPWSRRTERQDASTTDGPEPAAQRCWSVLGPRSIGNRWLSMGTSGHGRHARIAGRRTAFTTTTSTAKQHGTGFETLSLHHEDGRTRPRQPCPHRALSNGSQRSPTVSNGQLPRPLTCVTACHWAAGQCFPSSRCSCCWGSPGLGTADRSPQLV